MTPLSVGAALLVVSLSLASLIVRRLVQQPAAVVPVRGRHRRPLSVTGWCRAERRITQQAPMDVAGQLVCASCGHIIPGGGR